MALIECSECGKEISDRAVACPNCGFPLIANSERVKENQISSNKEEKRSAKPPEENRKEGSIGTFELYKNARDDVIWEKIIYMLDEDIADKADRSKSYLNENLFGDEFLVNNSNGERLAFASRRIVKDLYQWEVFVEAHALETEENPIGGSIGTFELDKSQKIRKRNLYDRERRPNSRFERNDIYNLDSLNDRERNHYLLGLLIIPIGLIFSIYILSNVFSSGQRRTSEPQKIQRQPQPQIHMHMSPRPLGNRMMQRMEDNLIDQMMPRTPTQIEIGPMQPSYCRPYCF